MALIDFATVQVYEMEDIVEVVFPFNREFSGFLKSKKGRWEPKRKCWQLRPGLLNTNSIGVVNMLEEKMVQMAPKKWPQILEILRSHGCVTSKFEVFAGQGGVRLAMPLGHPCHHYLKKVDGLENVRTKWMIPSHIFRDPVVQQAYARILDEDFKKYREFIDPVEERCLLGVIKLPAEQEEAYGLKKGELIAVQPSFLDTADPAMSDTPANEIAFEVLKAERTSDGEVKVRLEYADPEIGYNFLKGRVYADQKAHALSHANIEDDHWIQKRL